MTASYREREGFAARVSLACKYISERRTATRTFDTCFEMNDGDAVAVAVYRRSKTNPKIRANLWRYLCRHTAITTAFAHRRVATKNLPVIARQQRAASEAAFALALKEQARRNARAAA